jgi:Fe-S oxidoreductase/nitrate reductase gamma subunit
MTASFVAPTARDYFGIPGTTVFGMLVAATIAVFAYSASRRFQALLAGRRENRADRLVTRVARTVRYAFLQIRMFRDPYAGIMHILIFSGFVVLTIRTSALVVEGFVPAFEVFSGGLGHVYNFAKDIVEVLTFVGVAMAAYRRLFAKPKRLDLSWDASFILILIDLLIVTDLLADASRIALDPSRAGWWTPVTAPLSAFLTAFGPSSGALLSLFTVCWWVHLVDIFFFGNYLPYSKHFHIIVAIPNIFTQKLEPMGRLASLDLENSETFGASKIEDFSWKQLLDGYTCTECGRCRVVCPTALTDKPLDPKVFIGTFRDAFYADTPRLLAAATGRPMGGDGETPAGEAGKPLLGGWISEDTIWACTTCGYCTSACPVFIIPAVDKIVEMRRHLVLDRAEFPKEMQTAFRGMETNGNPWGIGAATRADWARDLPVVTMAEADRAQVEYLFWVGCAGSYEDRARRVSKALVELLDRAGVRFAILGTEETCNGDSARRMGNEYLFQTLARQNVETMNGYGVKKIVTNCPHCLNCLKNEYPQFGGSYEVIHGTELVARLIAEGRIRMEGEVAETITFHDPCYLGRYNGVYDAPRRILEAIPGLTLKEMERSKERGLCCGAGGGRMWMEEKLGSRINQTRMKEIAAMGTEKVGVSCPFCMVMIANAKEEIQEGPPAFDVLELARAAMQEGEAR